MKKLFRIFLFICIGALMIITAVYFWIGSRQETAALNETTRTDAPGKFLKLDEGMVHYQLQGPDTGRLIVFVHGGGATGMEVWKNTASYFLQRGYRILMYDLYGRGYSDRTRTTYSPALFRQQLSQVLDSLHIDTPFDFIAMSMGSAIALDYAVIHPGKVKKIILLGPAVGGDLKPSKLLEVPGLAQLLMTCYWYPRSVDSQRKEFVNKPEFEKYAERLRYFMNFSGHKYITLSTWQNMLNKDQLTLFTKIQPDKIMLIYGRQDPFFPVDYVPRYKKYYPTMIVREIDQAGHMPHYEQPVIVNGLIAAYFDNTL